jgi:hypothetical protein
MNAMPNNNIQLTRSIAAIFWLGFFMAISFMEAPLKFTAPNLSMAEGLQIGKIVFGALNYCEWAFLVVIIITCFVKMPGWVEAYLIGGLATILILETCWLLPALDLDAKKIIRGETITGHGLHWYYVILEIIKVPVLLLTGLKGLKSIINPVKSI